MDIVGLVNVPDWLITLLGILIAAYVYYARKFSFWTSRGVKQMSYPLPFFGHMWKAFSKPLHEVDLENYKKLGRIYGMYEGTRPVLIVGEPELVRKILVKDFHIFPSRRKIPFKEPMFENALSVIKGERWKYMRAIVSQTFSSGKMRKMVPLLSECAHSLVENLQDAAERNESVDCKKIVGAFTMDVIASCAFATKIDTHKDPDNLFVKYARQVFDVTVNLRFILLFAAPKLCELIGLRFVKPEISDFYLNITQKIIKSRNEKKEERNDFLQLLLNASKMSKNEDTEVSENPMELVYEVPEKDISSDIHNIYQAINKKELTEMEVLSQCFLFFVAGYETTATTISYALYHMALEPELQEKLIEEIDRISEENSEITYDTLAKMPYLDAFVSETLRFNSPAIRVEREAEDDYQLGDTGIILPKGTLVSIPVYAMHHDPKLFPDPEKFDPERFMPENKESIVPYSYLPFGGGPRNCVALRFALMESKLCLAKVLQHCRFSRCQETQVPPKYKPGSQLLLPRGIILKVEKRARSSQECPNTLAQQ